MQQPRKQYPSLRRGLLRLHDDLLRIHSKIDPYAAEHPPELTVFERCVLVLEDRRFFKHMGIDWKRIAREALKACLFMKHGGASTIDMQFVRTATGYRRRNVKRKIYECVLSYIIQHRYSKITTLRSYLEIAYFGTGLRGSRSAAYALFKKGADELNLDEAAYLAAMLVFPKPRNPSDAWEKRHLRRANYIKFIYPRRENHFNKIEQAIFL